MKLLCFFLLTISVHLYAYIPRKDWTQHFHCSKDTRYNKEYCLEIVEISKDDKSYENSVLLIPGLTHNAHIFDLDPKNDISVARYIEKNFNLKVYILNIRVVGSSQYLRDSNLDDIVIDDVTKAIDFVWSKQKSPIIVIGHSQGAISANAALSGLTRCGKKNCFSKKIALERQKKVKSLGLLAGNNKLRFEKSNLIYRLSIVVQKIMPTLYFYDKIDIEFFTRTFKFAGKFDIFDFLVNEDNVSDQAKIALLDRGVDASSKAIIHQLTLGNLRGDLQTIHGESYAEASKNLIIPVYHQIFGKDPLAPWEATITDTFDAIGSGNKHYEVFPNQGHEDFILNPNLHRNLDSMLDFLIP